MRKMASGIGKVFVLLCAFATATAQTPETVRVKPKESFEVLNNPGIGFTTFQRFNGDTLNAGAHWTEGLPIVYQDFDGDLANKDHPQTSIAYFRVSWKFLETAPGDYHWPLIDKALRTAAERGQTLMLRISPYQEEKDRDVPAWYRKMVEPEKKYIVDKWRVDHEDPRYLQYFGNLIRALGQRYDGHPDLEGVDIAIVGYWGEGEGSHLLSDPTRIALLNAYLDHFKKTPLFYQPLNGDAPDPGVLVKGTAIAASWPDGRNNGTGPQMRHVGYRIDCLGDLSNEMWTKQKWSHMEDIYPRDIIKSGMSEAWKKAPITMEICGTFLYWMHHYRFDEKTVEKIFGEALKWHISSFNAKSSAVPKEWSPLVDKWLNKMGYRFVIRKLEYPSVVFIQEPLPVLSLLENIGVAPIYKNYSLALRLKNNGHTVLLPFDVDLRNWLPGDILLEENLYIPHGTPPGEYDLDIAIVSPVGYEPRVQLAIEGRKADGWYGLGRISVQKR